MASIVLFWTLTLSMSQANLGTLLFDGFLIMVDLSQLDD